MASSTTACRFLRICHRGWSTHLARERYRQAQPNQLVIGFCVTSGDLGTYAMHPPRKRQHQSRQYVGLWHLASANPSTINVSKRNGRAQRPAPTQRFFHRKSEIVSASRTAHTRGIHHASAFTKVANTWHLPRKRYSHQPTRPFIPKYESSRDSPSKKKTLPAASRYGKGPIFTNKQTKRTT